MKQQELIFTIIARILTFPFFLAMTFTYIMLLYLRLVINFIRFGGESITYTKKNSRKLIGDIYNHLENEHINNCKNCKDAQQN